MTLEAVNTVVQIVGAIAVLASLIFVGLQLRQNTRSIRAAAGFEATHSWATFNELLIQMPDFLLLLAQAHDSTRTWDDFTDIERVRIGTAYRALFQKLEGLYFLYKYGSVDEALWEARRQWAAGVIKLPVWKQWWVLEKTQNIWSEEFVRAIETARDTSTLAAWEPPGLRSGDPSRPQVTP